jgi:hypothetical protein
VIIRVPSAEQATEPQFVVAPCAVQVTPTFKAMAFPARTACPAFCANFQPPVPEPDTRTISPGFGDAGKVMVTKLELLAK